MNDEPERVRIDLAERSYDILIGTNLLERPASYSGLPVGAAAVIVTNETVAPLFAAQLKNTLGGLFRRVELIVLPDGESHKAWPAMNAIFDGLLASGCDRKTVMFALGGGVVGDMTGFAAACYMRGVPYVQVPTTLLAQVDSSVGGKTAINHPLGKNMIGVFNQPLRVIADLATLDSLPQRELIAGLAEVIKYGPIADDVFLDWVDANLDALMARDKPALMHAIRRSCEIKAWVVGQDERESGLRAVLNFGHTFGHAIEAGLGFGEWLHGEAVGCGMVMAADLSVRLGLIERSYADKIISVIERAGLPTKAPRLGAARYFELMERDKKADAGKIRFVLIESAGRATMLPAPRDVVKSVIDANCD